jgi:hypothetical protein
MNYGREVYLPAFATSQGSFIISPATNLNVSDRDMKLGSALLMCGVTVKTRKKIKQLITLKVIKTSGTFSLPPVQYFITLSSCGVLRNLYFIAKPKN